MYLDNGHSKQTPAGDDGQNAFLPGVAPIDLFKRLDSLDTFKIHCSQHGYSLKEQWQMIDQYGIETSSVEVGKSLADYKEELGATICRLTGQEMTSSQQQNDVAPTPPPDGRPTTEPQHTAQVLPTYSLTQHGAKLDNNVWDNVIDAMMRQNYLDKAEEAGFRNLLGIARHSGRYRPLTEPVRLNMTKQALAFLIALMYGTFTYRLPCDVTVGNRMVHKGRYRCQPLIVVPSGKGPDKHGRTRDPYWDTLNRSAVTRNRDSGNKRSYSTARKEELSPEVAAFFIAMLEPLGCKRVEG